MTTVVIILAVAAFITWGVIASKRTSARKKEAIADLQVQQDQMPTFDIHALVSAEVEDLNLRSINGAVGIPASILLKTWKENTSVIDACPSRDLLGFVVTPGIDPSEALDADVSLVCDFDPPVTEGTSTDERPHIEDTPERADEEEPE